MRAAVGTELSRRVSYPISASDIRRWALAVYWPERPPAQFLIDADSAGTNPDGSLKAPEEFNPFAWAVADSSTAVPAATNSGDLGPDRMEIQAGIRGPGLTRELNGGMAVEYGVSMRSGDVITSITQLGPYSERTGRLGLMLFSTVEDIWTNQLGEQVKRTVNTLIRY
ncbi:hypothetical protein G352_15660 [Rhodococcus ruber BKS 20-38]|uniref:FAS1-like dehydratase domain-containing protein n=1 Tax=Rhodococcus ruber BKS 20-38 TaxID=1278076 RepID=M2Z6L2_9NOCA|nr:MaoC family dehydratase N-terminal domain-containing protein [Rhodococcus ruber]EME62892.1 hypothetical protein G352_15660 [Rhodococcus ruber BKS 20-38]